MPGYGIWLKLKLVLKFFETTNREELNAKT
jgi:hypothetical protein